MFISDLSRLNFRDYDFEDYKLAPSVVYVIACGPRTGSNWLCRILWAERDMGAPHEYFNEIHNVVPLATRFSSTTPMEYLKCILQHRTSSNGVFGCKVLFNQWSFATPFINLIKGGGVEIKFISLERLDKLGQAISHVRASETSQWTSSMRSKRRPEYNASAIKSAYQLAFAQALSWKKIFDRMECLPLHITYEELVDDAVGTLGEVRIFVTENIPKHSLLPGVATEKQTPPAITRQMDGISAEWRGRFAEEEREFLRQFDELLNRTSLF